MKDDRSSKLRIYTFAALIIFTFFVYTIYLFNLQIVKGLHYKKKAKEVTQREIVIPAQRGEIYDRNYNLPLVDNIESFAVYITPGEILSENRASIYNKISRLLDIKRNVIERKIPPKYRHLFQPIEIKSGVSYSKIAYLAEHIDEFPGVTWHNKPIRRYRVTSSLSHVLGYVGNITNEELQILYNKGYSPGTILGKSGIEKEYDKVLRGKDGKKYKIVDVKEEIEKLKQEMKLKEAEKEKEFLYSRLEALSAMAPKLQKLEEELAEIKKGGGQKTSLTDELKQYQELRNAILEFAKQEGLSAPKEGEKINWSELLRELLGFGKEAVKKLPTSAEAPPKKITPISPEQVQQLQLQTQKPESAKVPEKMEVFEELPKAPINPPKE